jgi:Zn-dependent protease with chaperone function
MQQGEDERPECWCYWHGWKVLDEQACPGGQETLTGPGSEGESTAPGCGIPQNPSEDPCALPPKISRWHVLKIITLAALGYAYVCLMLSVLLGMLYRVASFVVRSPDPLVFLIIGTPVLLVLVVLLAGTVRTLWIRTQPPDGFELTQFDAPELFEALELIRMETRGPKIGKVLLTGNFNAFIARIPRLGVFGWHRNYLVLGLPLLQALSTRQMLAVLAHEYGHLSGVHGRLGSWVYEVRKSWMQVLRKIEQKRGFGQILLARFFLWYAPYFHSLTLGLARAREYEADLCSVAIAGKDQTAAALVRFEVLDRYLHELFWPSISSMMDTRPEPVPSVYALMQERFSQGMDGRKVQEWLDLSLCRETDPADTHPCLRERLRAISEVPALPPAPSRSAAQYYFPYLDEVRRCLDDEWSSLVRKKWQERHEHVQKARARLSELVSMARLKPLSAGETLELANLTEDLSGHDKAFPYYQRILEYLPRYVPALCAVGRIWLAKGDESGVSYIEKAMALDPKFRVRGLEALYNFYVGKGDLEKTGKYYQELSEQRASMERARMGRRAGRLPARYMVARKRSLLQGMLPPGT